jgi:hypothetical protein
MSGTLSSGHAAHGTPAPLSSGKTHCRQLTPVRMAIQTVGTDCEGNKIDDMYGFQGRYKSLGDTSWVELDVILYPQKVFDFGVPVDGEIEFQWRALRHGVKWQPGTGSAAVYSTIPGPWSDSTVISVACAAPVKGQPATVELTPNCVC